MSGQATVNLVDDEEMSSQGSVHSPLIGSSVGTPVQTPVIQQSLPVAGSPLRPQSPVARIAPTVQSSVLMQPSALATTIPVAAASGSGQPGSVAPTIPVEVPTLEDTKAAFQEVSSTFRDMSAQHGQIQGNLQALASTVQALRQSKQEEQQTSVQVQETLKRTASVASELEMRIGEQSMMQEQSRVTAERAQQIGEQALQETRQLQLTQQSAAAELKRSVREIGLKIQEQADKTLLQEQTVKAEQEKAKEQLSQQMREKMDSTQQQAVEATQLAVQAQSVAQFASSTITDYEKKMTDISHTVAQLQQLVIEERKRRMTMESQLSSAQDKIGAAERQSRDLSMKNQQLASEVASWQTAFNTQVTSQPIPVASSSTMPQMQPATQPQMPRPQTIPLQSPQGPLPRIGEIQEDDRIPMGQQSTRRVSFGSVFDASSGQNGGGHNNEENLNEWGEPQNERNATAQPNTALFNLEIKPKDPPMFYGRAAEDVSTWISKVSDFFYLTRATDRQQVAYAATFLQEAAAD